MNEAYGELGVDELELFARVLTAAEMTDLFQAGSSGKCKPTSPCTNSVVSIFCPPDMFLETCETNLLVSFPSAFAVTSCGGITNLAAVPPSGSVFPLGATVVTWTATDSQGISASCQFTVTVIRDRTPPVCPPAAITVTGCPPRVPDFATNGMITDNCSPAGQLSVVQNPAAGTALPPGLTLVTLTACDAAGNCAQCLVAVTAVTSGTPPVITCPSNVVATGYSACSPTGATVGYPLPQVVNGALASSTPPSGSLFPWGTTTVVCVATNACETNVCTFTVTVNFGGVKGPCTPPPPNLVLWLKFDETSGTTALNASAGNHGTLFNGPTRTLGQYVVNSLGFDGVNDYVQVQPYAAMQFGTGDFSVDA